MENNIVDEYAELIWNKYGEYRPTIIAYGSNCYGENNSDLDVCILISESFKNESQLINDTVEFSINNKLKVDDEIPHSNKLIYKYDEVGDILTHSVFVRNNVYSIHDIRKTKDYLSSYEMKARLLINIFTTEHNILCGFMPFVNKCEEQSWMIILDAIYNVYKLKLDSDDATVLELLYQNPITMNCGETYLGYKKNDRRKMEYLNNRLHIYNAKYKKYLGE